MNIRLAIDFDVTPELVKLYALSTHCPFVGEKDGPYDEERAASELKRIAETKKYGNCERLGIMKIFQGDTLVGFSLPRVILEKEHKVFKLDTTDTYHRVGTVFIDPEHRGKGIMKKAINAFIDLYPNVVWTCDEKNIASGNSAVSGGLKFSHLIYFKSREEWSFEPMEDHIRVSNVYVS